MRTCVCFLGSPCAEECAPISSPTTCRTSARSSRSSIPRPATRSPTFPARARRTSARLGSATALRVAGPAFDVSVNGTYVHATFDDTDLLIPYVPDLVVRGDGAIFTDLPWKGLNLEGKPARITFATGITFVGRRPLPFG